LSRHNDLLIQRFLSVLRIVSAYLLIQYDTAKLFGFPHVASFDNLQILSLIGVAGILEVLGGTLLLIGLLARSVAFILSGLLAFAYFIGGMATFSGFAMSLAQPADHCGRHIPMVTPAFFRMADAIRITALSRATLYRRIAEKKFPPPVHLGGRACG
jgi:uncharacterized membrane protein YphA (DoxX/SURF4 family)